jgi:hypothetical protein
MEHTKSILTHEWWDTLYTYEVKVNGTHSAVVAIFGFFVSSFWPFKIIFQGPLTKAESWGRIKDLTTATDGQLWEPAVRPKNETEYSSSDQLGQDKTKQKSHCV